MTAAPQPGVSRRAHGLRQDWLIREKSAEIFREGLGSGVTTRRVLLQTFEADGLKVRGDTWVQPPRGHRLGTLDLSQHFLDGFATEGGPARQQVIKNRAQRINIGLQSGARK